jgi:hypothetical protein
VPETRPASEWDAVDLGRYEGAYELEGGGRIIATVENGALQLNAADQRAIDALLFPGSRPGAHAGLNDRSRTLVEAALSGDRAPFDAELGEGERARRFQGAIERQIEGVAQMTGEDVTGVTTVGTVPYPYMDGGVVASGVRFRTASGENGRLSLLWRDGKLVGLDMLMFTPTVPFVPAAGGGGEGELAGYHLVWAKPFSVKVREGTAGVDALVLGGGVLATPAP